MDLLSIIITHLNYICNECLCNKITVCFYDGVKVMKITLIPGGVK